MKIKVISGKNLPVNFPISNTVIVFLLIDNYKLPFIVCAGLIIAITFLWLIAIAHKSMEQPIEIFEEPNEIKEAANRKQIIKESENLISKIKKRSNELQTTGK